MIARRIVTVLVAMPLMLLHASLAGAAEQELRTLLDGPDRLVLIRHATAPGTGDPPDFRLGDCATQRNLSDEGRAQAARIGARIREAGVTAAHVLSSQWCRCLQTAEALGLGPVEELPALNSFFGAREREAEQTAALLAWIAAADLSRPAVLVTHQVNITALTRAPTSSGEMVILRRTAQGVEVLGRARTP